MARQYNYQQKPGESLEAYYHRIAKVADQRLLRLENLEKQEGYGNATQWAYKRALSDIATWSGSDASRFNTKAPTNTNQLKAKINDIKTFLGSESSTKTGIQNVYNKRVNTLNERYGTHFQPDDLQKVFGSSVWKKLDAKNFSSDQIYKAIGYIADHATDEETLRALQAQARKRNAVPDFTGDEFADLAIRDMLRSRTSVEEMYQYFKSI